MISPSTHDASTAAIEEVVTQGVSTSSVETGTCSGDDVEGSSGLSLSPLKPYSPSSTTCSPPFPCHLHTQRYHVGKEQSHRRSHHMTQQTVLVSRLNTP
jgi:hypothetical protein